MKRALNWATGRGYIPFSPIAKMERPEGGTRTLTISPEEFAELLGKNRDVHFRDLLEFSWEAGGRPQEVKGLEARHVDWKRSLCVYHYSEAKKEKTRVIYLTDKALSMVRRLAKTALSHNATIFVDTICSKRKIPHRGSNRHRPHEAITC
jgi:integrase